MELPIRLLDPDLQLPARALEGDAGLDLRARVGATLSASVGPVTVPTGVAVAIPEGYVGLICPRSGLASREGIGILNAPGVVDSGYRGELHVVLFGVHVRAHGVRRGDRIAQLLIAPLVDIELAFTEVLPPSHRGAAGFGSTGRA